MIKRLKALCNQHNTTFAAVERALNFANGSLIKSKENKISASRVYSLAEYFHVSMEYILKGTLKPVYTPEINDFIDRLNKLPTEYQNEVYEALTYQEYRYAESLKKKDSNLA